MLKNLQSQTIVLPTPANCTFAKKECNVSHPVCQIYFPSEFDKRCFCAAFPAHVVDLAANSIGNPELCRSFCFKRNPAPLNMLYNWVLYFWVIASEGALLFNIFYNWKFFPATGRHRYHAIYNQFCNLISFGIILSSIKNGQWSVDASCTFDFIFFYLPELGF